MAITTQTQDLLDALQHAVLVEKPAICNGIDVFAPTVGQLTTAAVTLRDRLRSAQMAEVSPEVTAEFEKISQALGALMRVQGDLDRALTDAFTALQTVERYTTTLQEKAAAA